MIKVDPLEHARLPWRLHAIAGDFELEDVWRLPMIGGPDDFDRCVQLFVGLDPLSSGPCAVRALFTVRLLAGRLFESDGAAHGAERNATLVDRLPDDLREAPAPPTLKGAALQQAAAVTPLYRTDDEWAIAIASGPVDGIMHLGWAAGEDGAHHAQLAILVKRHGLLGRAYMAAIGPARRFVVYPLLGRQLARRWRVSASTQVAAPRPTAT